MSILSFNHKVVQEDSNQSGTEKKVGGESPKYVVKCKDIFSSTMKGLEDCAPCDWVKTGGSRIATFDSSGKLNGDTTITGKDPVICMQYGPWAPVLQEFMYSGKPLEQISVYRLMDINGEKIKIQELNYSVCLIKTYDQEADKILFTFCFSTLEDLQIAYNQDGHKLGQNGMQFDFTTLEIKNSKE